MSGSTRRRGRRFRSARRRTLFVLRLNEPLVAEGPYGRRRRVERVGFSVDDAASFEAKLRAALASGS
ncbi:MAG TPA: hypothetical protein VN783_03140 [Thermoanaerobaculia bacterium]|nr:hypothetical protein [Thermoanaerobaculia bacterium]